MNHFKEIQAQLAAFNLDAVALTCRENRFYASGFQSHGEDGVALVTRDAVYFWTDMRYCENAEAQVEDAAIGLSNGHFPYHKLLSDAIEAHGIRRLGMDEGYMTVRAWRHYEKKLPCELVGATALLESLRAVKDPEELRRIEAAQRIAERALQEVLNDIKSGVTERFLAARLTYLMLSYGAENVSFDPVVVSGAKSSVPHGVPSDKMLEPGDFVTMDFGALYGGYCSDMTRTVAVGHATDEMQTVYDTVLRAQLAGIAVARAGVPGREVDGAARAVIVQAGYGDCFGHGFGHSLGVEIHEPPNANPRNDQPLPAGAVITAEPGIYLPGRFGVRIEDMLLIEECSCRNLTMAPKELLIM